MKYTFALLALAASVFAQGVPTGIAPSSPAPSGCQLTVSGTFEINVVNVTLTSKRDLTKVSFDSYSIPFTKLKGTTASDRLRRTRHSCPDTQQWHTS